MKGGVREDKNKLRNNLSRDRLDRSLDNRQGIQQQQQQQQRSKYYFMAMTQKGSMSITHVFSRNVTYKEKCFRHIEIMIFTTIFLNCVFNTRNEKKSVMDNKSVMVIKKV